VNPTSCAARTNKEGRLAHGSARAPGGTLNWECDTHLDVEDLGLPAIRCPTFEEVPHVEKPFLDNGRLDNPLQEKTAPVKPLQERVPAQRAQKIT